MRALLLFGCYGVLAGLSLAACTGGGMEDEGPAVSDAPAAAPQDVVVAGETGAANAGGAPAVDAQERAAQDAGLDAMDAAQPGNAVDSATEPPTPPAAVKDPTAPPSPPASPQKSVKASKAAATAGGPTKVPVRKTKAVPGRRVVRYVRAATVDIHGGADNAAPAVGHLSKGDIVMVVEQGDWGKIADNMFVKLSNLSDKAVPRPAGKEATWQAPKG